MLFQSIWQHHKVQRFKKRLQSFSDYFPAIFFVGGFAWDAKTFGGEVTMLDLLILTSYLLISALILYFLSQHYADENKYHPKWIRKILSTNWPYFVLQFLFGTLLNVLFVLYFKSTGHILAWLMTLSLGIILVATEHFKDRFREFTLSWALFSFCTMMLFNFLIPFLIGSINAAWFYISTLLGTVLAYSLYLKTPNHLGSIKPVWCISMILMLAYAFDVIPPVPLVKREIAVGYMLKKVGDDYLLSQQPSSWWIFWRKTSDDLQVDSGQRIYCFSSVSAPEGLKARLFHVWQHHDKESGWQTMSRVGFTLSGGRYNGFRGYTFKSDLQAGDWKVRVVTENNKTVAVQEFTVRNEHSNLIPIVQKY